MRLNYQNTYGSKIEKPIFRHKMDDREKGRGLHTRSKKMQPLPRGKTLHYENTPKKPSQQKIRDRLKMQTPEQISHLKDKTHEDNSDESSRPRKPRRQ